MQKANGANHDARRICECIFGFMCISQRQTLKDAKATLYKHQFNYLELFVHNIMEQTALQRAVEMQKIFLIYTF